MTHRPIVEVSMNVRVLYNHINPLRSHNHRPQSERCLGDHEIEPLFSVHLGDIILCTHGVLWVTQEGDPQDYMLQKGETYVADRPGLLLIQSFDDSAFFSFTHSLDGH